MRLEGETGNATRNARNQAIRELERRDEKGRWDGGRERKKERRSILATPKGEFSTSRVGLTDLYLEYQQHIYCISGSRINNTGL